jgi:UDP-N-acetylmuramoyl-tripeptide--D-alanyl-D-alanine ligase
MANALECLKHAQTEGKKVFICGTMAELGAKSEVLHAELGSLIAKSEVDVLLTAGEFAKIVAEEAESHDKEIKTQNFADTDELCDNLQGFVGNDDIILVKGSRSMQLEKAVEKLKQIFGSEN